MQADRFRAYIIIVFFLSILSSSALFARKPTFRPNAKNLNVMTVMPTHDAPEISECDLVKKIYNRQMPKKAVIGIEGKNYCYQAGLHSCIKKANCIYLMSRGYAKRKRITGPDKDNHFIRSGGCVIHTRDRIAQNIVHLSDDAIAVTFDYKDGYVNFGQKRDIACLRYVYNATRTLNPSAHIIIVSECLGAKVALELAAQHPITNTTLVLESPFFQATELFDAMANNYIGWSASASILNCGTRFVCHYDWRQDDLPARLKNIPNNVRIFACHRNGDPLLGDEHFATHMKTIGNHIPTNSVTCYRFDDIETRHSRSFRWTGSQRAVNTFYKQHRLPYNESMVMQPQAFSKSFASYLASACDGISQMIAPFFAYACNRS